MRGVAVESGCLGTALCRFLTSSLPQFGSSDVWVTALPPWRVGFFFQLLMNGTCRPREKRGLI